MLGFPAHAGMDPANTADRRLCGTVASPHTRGWTWTRVGREQNVAGGHAGLSPHTRGWTR